MKKIYKNAEIELIALATTDVVTTSEAVNVAYNEEERGVDGGNALFSSIFKLDI